MVNGDAVLLLAAREMNSGMLANATVVAARYQIWDWSRRSSDQVLDVAGQRRQHICARRNAAGWSNAGRRTVGPHIVSRWGCDRGRTADRAPSDEGDGVGGKALADLVGGLKVFPQHSVMCGSGRKLLLRRFRVQSAIAAAERELEGNGQAVVSCSGTEALARVMIEGGIQGADGSLAEAIVGRFGRRWALNLIQSHLKSSFFPIDYGAKSVLFYGPYLVWWRDEPRIKIG